MVPNPNTNRHQSHSVKKTETDNQRTDDTTLGRDDTDKQADGDTMHVSPPGRERLRPGEISMDELQQQADTRQFGDVDYEEGDPRWGTARFGQRMMLEIQVRHADEKFLFPYDEVDEIVIGRRDPTTNYSPEVDLEPHGALNKGVSRQHALISQKGDALQIVDQGSPNGTYLNGQKLIEHQARILRDGDDIRLGHLVVRINFRLAKNLVT